MLPPGEQRAAYAQESRELCWQGVRTACLLAIPLVPSFAILDAIVFPAYAGFFLRARLACTAGILVLFWLLHRPVGRRNALAVGVVLSLVLGGMINAMVVWTGGETSPYYAGISLI